MKITRATSKTALVREIERWAAGIGWKGIALQVARQRPDFVESAATARDLHNIEQQIKRALRGETEYYRHQLERLEPELLAALPAERRARLVDPDNPVLLATVAAREGILAVNAVHLSAPADVIEKKIEQAIAAFCAVRDACNRGFYGGASVHATLHR